MDELRRWIANICFVFGRIMAVIESKRIFAIRFATCRITRNLPASGPLLMICHNRVAASQLIRRSLHSSWYKQAPTHCLLLRAIEAGVLFNSIKKQPTHPGPFYGPDGRLFERLILPVVPHFRQLYEHLHHSIFLKKNQPGISTNYGKQVNMGNHRLFLSLFYSFCTSSITSLFGPSMRK